MVDFRYFTRADGTVPDFPTIHISANGALRVKSNHKTPKQVSIVGLVVKPRLAEIEHFLTELTVWLEARGCTVIADEYAGAVVPPTVRLVKSEEIRKTADLIVVVGGDGTMIAAARIVGRRSIPVIGVNFGFLGYLTEYSPENVYSALESVLEDSFRIDSRMKLEATILRDGKQIARDEVINDVVVNKSNLARIIEISCWIAGKFVSAFRADGLIVSTPTGSTAYSLSAGGPIVHPAMRAVAITPICPHTLTNRPIVVPDEAEIILQLTSSVTHGVQDVTLTLDGQVGYELLPTDRVVIRKSKSMLNLVEPPDRNYFQVLREKLKWGSL